eukprot:2378555-Rhodomonas_salina.1
MIKDPLRKVGWWETEGGSNGGRREGGEGERREGGQGASLRASMPASERERAAESKSLFSMVVKDPIRNAVWGPEETA